MYSYELSQVISFNPSNRKKKKMSQPPNTRLRSKEN